ncbi:MAG: molecular chaperone [Gammaproteobacteria bacterium]|jgi:fimbrial chaperone protein|nr:molecular chaperone [Gammaproteobacteria bacterium]
MNRRLKRIRLFSSLYAFLFCAHLSTSAASGFTIFPVRLELSNERGVGAFTLTNDSDHSVTLDVRAMRWTQADGVDQLTDTRELLATPPIFTLAPGAAQIVRIGLRRAPDANQELTYRLFVTEIPAKAPRANSGVAMSLRLSVPVFVRPVVATTAKIEWSGERTSDGRLTLRARNTSAMHMQIADLRVQQRGVLVATHVEPTYLLGGQTRVIPLALQPGADVTAGAIDVSGFSDAGNIHVEIGVAQASTTSP